MDRVLIVAAHPDDEVLGCGGVMSKLVKSGSKVFTLILGEGATSRDKNDTQGVQKLQQNAKDANAILGVSELFFGGLPDNSFDSVKLLDVINIIESVKSKIAPTTVFTHWSNDLNIDHQITNQATLTAFRAMPNEKCKDVFAFYTLSSSEWNHPNTFSPNVFFDISAQLGVKKNAMAAYCDELREYPHPRSLQGIENLARFTGQSIGVDAAEGFMLLRSIR